MTVKACPECDCTGPRFNPGGTRSNTSNTTRYTCRECGHKFNKPVIREKKQDRDERKGLSKKLAEMNPDDL